MMWAWARKKPSELRKRFGLGLARALLEGVRRLVEWQHGRGRVDDESYDERLEAIVRAEMLCDEVERLWDDEGPRPEPAFSGIVLQVQCDCCKVRRTNLERNLESGEDDIDDSWMPIPIDGQELYEPRYACPDCAPHIKAWMERHGAEYMPLSRLSLAGSSLEAALDRLADDLEAEGQLEPAERIRSELVLHGLAKESAP